MAAKPLTTEEINYLRSWYLTSIIGTDAVKAYFDRVHPPAVLETHLANDKLALESLKQDGIISKAMWEKMYPKPRARPTSADFDITILICLLREMIPKVQSPRGGFDHLPHKADTSGACLAIIKHYRNFLAHPDQEKLRALSSTKFNDLFTQVEKAIQVLGNNQYSSKITVAKKLNIDNDIAQILEKIVTYEKQFQDLQEEVNRNSSQTRYHEKEIKELREKYEEIENNQMLETEEEIPPQQVKKQMSEIESNLKLQKEALEKKVKEQKQLAATQTKHGKQIQTLEQETGLMKKTQEDQRKDMKEWTEKHYAITSRTEELEKKTNENKEKTKKLAEIQTMQHQSIQIIGQEQEEQRKEVKELKENQQSMPNHSLGFMGDHSFGYMGDHSLGFMGDHSLGFMGGIYPKIINRRKIDEITLPESFEKIKEVNKGADALRDNDIVILVGIKGSGKSTIGKAIIKQYCEGNPDYDMIQLSTTTESDIIYCDPLGFFCSSNQVVVFLDDLFGRVPSTYAFKEHLMLLRWVYEKQDGIKILSTVQAETKACVEELFASDQGDALLISAEIINLHSTIYPRRDMLIKSGFNEESSDSIIRQLKETAVQERIGFPALVSIYKENQELGDELFINPGNVFMKYLSSLKEGSDHDKMYFVILIHVLMTGKVHETQNTSDEESMCHIATTIFGNTLEFQKYDSSIESIIDEKEDGILMNKNDPFCPYYCFKDEITPDFIFQYYKEEGIREILTTCSLNCIVSYFRPSTDTLDEPLVCIDSSLYQSIASHIINIIQKDLKTSRVSDVSMSVKTLCMSLLLQDENFLNALMIECDQLSIQIYGQTVNVTQSYDRIGSLIKGFHFPSMLLYQSCRQLNMMYRENVKVVKTIFWKLCHTGEKEDSLTAEEKEELCQTINTMVKFSMEELCKDNIDKNVVLEMLWKFIMDKKVDCQYNHFLMNAWRNQCSKTVIWLQENIRDPNCLQMERCFQDICHFIGVHKTSWILKQNPKSGQNKISMYKVFKKELERRPDLLDYIWKWEERILEDYKRDEQLHADASTANVKKNIANMVMEIALKEVHSTSKLFRWACDTFKPHTDYFDKTMIKKIEREKTKTKRFE